MDYLERMEQRGLHDIGDDEDSLKQMFLIAQRIGYADFYSIRSTVQSVDDYHVVMERYGEDLSVDEETGYDSRVDVMKVFLMMCGWVMAAEDHFTEKGMPDEVLLDLREHSDRLMNFGLEEYTALKNLRNSNNVVPISTH